MTRNPKPETRSRHHGFTLVELVAVIAITGIIVAVVAIFILIPVRGYLDAARRAELVDIADTALRRMGRDVHLALPNSVRVTGGNLAIEFLQTRTGGRYRAMTDSSGNGDILDFTVSDTHFDQLGPFSTLPGQQIVAGDLVAIYNLGIPGADAYNADNTSVISSTAAGDLPNENKINFSAKKFPFASPSSGFRIVSGPVSYICDLTAGTLRRYWGYAVQATQPNPPTGGSSALLAQNVSACDIQYDQLVLNQRNGLVSMRLQLTKGNETVSLYHEVHVSNVP